ncbi:hypothetical protein AOLI_G00122420 [Acnodon oligacanthus]
MRALRVYRKWEVSGASFPQLSLLYRLLRDEAGAAALRRECRQVSKNCFKKVYKVTWIFSCTQPTASAVNPQRLRSAEKRPEIKVAEPGFHKS